MTTIKTTASGLHPGHGGNPDDKGKHQHGVNVTPLEERIAALENAYRELAASVGSDITQLEAKAHTHAPIPGPEPTPDPEPDEPPFLSRPGHNVFSQDGGSDLVIDNWSFVGSANRDTPFGIGITVRNVRNLRIANVDLANLVGGIYLYNISGRLEIENVRSRNIGVQVLGVQNPGAGNSNHIQLAESKVEGFIRGCRFLGGRTEDMLSIYHSGGLSVDKPLIVSDNHLQGLVADTATARAWNSGSGTGIIIGDGSGSSKNGHTIVRANTLLTPGQVGIQIIDGPGLTITENVIYGEQRAQSNNPMTTWEGTPKGEAIGNRYYWLNPSGGTVSPWKHPGGSGMAFTGNVQDPSIDPDSLRVVL